MLEREGQEGERQRQSEHGDQHLFGEQPDLQLPRQSRIQATTNENDRGEHLAMPWSTSFAGSPLRLAPEPTSFPGFPSRDNTRWRWDDMAR